MRKIRISLLTFIIFMMSFYVEAQTIRVLRPIGLDNENASVIISTHLIADIERILDEAVFIDKGRIVLQGDTDDLRRQENASIDEIFRRMFKC